MDKPLSVHMVRIWNRCQADAYGFFPITGEDLHVHVSANTLFHLDDLFLEPIGEPLGFAHLLTPEDSQDAWLAALVVPRGDNETVAALLRRVIGHAAEKKKRRIIYGSYRQRFYEPLHGTVAMPGIDQGSEWMIEILRTHGFEVVDSQITMKRPLQLQDEIDGDTDTWVRDLQEQGIDIVQLAHRPICYTFALIQGREVGHCTCLTLDRLNAYAGTHRAGVYMLGVSEFHRRKGIGRAMMLASIQTLATCGMREIELMTGADNLVAQTFYHALGFDVYRRWSEAILMVESST